jgi:hypothetical protein
MDAARESAAELRMPLDLTDAEPTCLPLAAFRTIRRRSAATATALALPSVTAPRSSLYIRSPSRHFVRLYPSSIAHSDAY